ncbi:NAD(+) diphosphatase [Nitratireductor basaltis]|uniref:NAD(+) diphosphatase n=1 Tax=Nitratireductor basaltis TaxID=472175 RepID=A0A084UEF6_9HYPH|nr:NAD(+) diphosphatase [Nitratireductor basaltis]KFB11342.1 NUDIX hydrolase [Nitratireductor basaltis]
MDHRQDVNAPKASLKLAFTGNLIDPQSESRNEESLPSALADPRVRVLVMSGGHLFMKQSSAGDAAWLTLEDAQGLAVDLEQAIFLGNDPAGPVVAATAGLDREQPPADFTAVPFRALFVEGLVDAAVLGAVAQGASLLAWNDNHRFCGRCGSETSSRTGGYRRHCEACDREHFPRTDPVAIMLAAQQDRCILGRSPHFAEGMYSCLAGFIEPGETIESAVRRETFEESGIRLGAVEYLASQPWPFPYSLMIGCIGEAISEDVDPDTAELEDCRWFSREEVLLMLEHRHPHGLKLPPPGAIAHFIVEQWARG